MLQEGKQRLWGAGAFLGLGLTRIGCEENQTGCAKSPRSRARTGT